jgi:hypothetical protein
MPLLLRDAFDFAQCFCSCRSALARDALGHQSRSIARQRAPAKRWFSEALYPSQELVVIEPF